MTLTIGEKEPQLPTILHFAGEDEVVKAWARCA